MKGIILAGGSGTRLFPITRGVSKQLMPIYDKPMIYYPLSILIEAGISEILIVTNPDDESNFYKLLGDGSKLGCKFSYAVQPKPMGIAEAFIIGQNFIGKDKVCLILGDNIFYGSNLGQKLSEVSDFTEGGAVFAYHVNDPERYGVIEFNEQKMAVSIEEKPANPKSSYAIPGIYFYDNLVVEVAKSLVPSSRGELEITDINNYYLQKKQLKVTVLDRGYAWLDTGTFSSMSQASQFVQVIEERQGLKIGCIEEVAWRKGLIPDDNLSILAHENIKSGYGKYLLNLLRK
jgi:glucose-1-phosphate thymidylyltransferase